MKFPKNYSIEGKIIKVFSDGALELSEGYYTKSFDNLEKAVQLAREIRDKQKSQKRPKTNLK